MQSSESSQPLFQICAWIPERTGGINPVQFSRHGDRTVCLQSKLSRQNVPELVETSGAIWCVRFHIVATTSGKLRLQTPPGRSRVGMRRRPRQSRGRLMSRSPSSFLATLSGTRAPRHDQSILPFGHQTSTPLAKGVQHSQHAATLDGFEPMPQFVCF